MTVKIKKKIIFDAILSFVLGPVTLEKGTVNMFVTFFLGQT